MTRYSSLLLLAILAVVLADNFYPTFEEYSKANDQHFTNDDEQRYRSAVYKSNLKNIIAHNNNPASTYKQGVNQFTGLTQAEMAELWSDKKLEKTAAAVAAPTLGATAWAPTPVDVTVNVTSVKSQTGCSGGSYAFAVVAAIEGLLIKNGSATTSIDLSEQQVLACSNNSVSGCNVGGNPSFTFQYATTVGLTTEANYPYGYTAGPAVAYCFSTRIIAPIYKIGGSGSITSCTTVAARLATISSPIVVTVDYTNWGSYTSGIFSNCSSTVVNHVATLVAVNSTVWKLKNSWGTTWGMAGYIYLNAAGGNNTCGVCNSATYPTK